MILTRLKRGFAVGVVATIAMSLLMVMALVSGLSPMPEPVPKAIVAELFGRGLPKPAMMGLALGLHLLYGGVFGATLAWVADSVTVRTGVGLGVALWMLMGIAFLPFVEWGLFGTGVTPRIAVATLVLHVVYGAVLGWALDRYVPPVDGESVAPA